MYHTGVERILGHAQAARERIQRATEARIGILLGLGPRAITLDAQIWLLDILIAEAAHLDRHEPRQLAAEIFDMHAGTTVDVRWIFVAEHGDFFQLCH